MEKPENITMFCQQCEEIARGLSGLAYRKVHQPAVSSVLADTTKQDKAAVEILFTTLTNFNFDKERFKKYLKTMIAYRDAYPKIPEETKECSWIPKSEEEII